QSGRRSDPSRARRGARRGTRAAAAARPILRWSVQSFFQIHFWRMILSKKRFALFRIMRALTPKARTGPGQGYIDGDGENVSHVRRRPEVTANGVRPEVAGPMTSSAALEGCRPGPSPFEARFAGTSG